MIITVTLNAAIDKTLAVPNFRLARRHRAVEQTSMAGGKGVNVARALKALGQPVIATGVAGGPTGTRIIEQLTEEAILNDFVRIREESRMSTAVVDPTSGEQTEINERGPTVSEAELELLRRQAALSGARDGPANRTAVPQGRHVHLLMARGAQEFESHFPGLLDDMVADGVPILENRPDCIHFGAAGHVLGTAHRLQDEFTAYVPSRPQLEWQIRRRVLAIENVEIVHAGVAEPTY